jgi:hypothetical protein
MEPDPHVPGWLFRDDGTLCFTLLGGTQVTYHNPAKDDLLSGASGRIERIILESKRGEAKLIEGPVVQEPWASRLREGDVRTMDVFFGQANLA